MQPWCKFESAPANAGRQLQTVEDRIYIAQQACPSSQAATMLGQHHSAAAMLTGPISAGMHIVYSGKNGEELWTARAGERLWSTTRTSHFMLLQIVHDIL